MGTPNLTDLSYYLSIAHDIIEEQHVTAHPSPSERRVCLLWAAWMCGRAGATMPSMDTLRKALHEVREREASVDLDARKIYCREDGRVIDFSC